MKKLKQFYNTELYRPGFPLFNELHQTEIDLILTNPLFLKWIDHKIEQIYIDSKTEWMKKNKGVYQIES